MEFGDRKPVSSLTLSQKGLDFICEFEEFAPKPYNDSNDPKKKYCTIGYGHLIDGKKSCETLASNGSKEYAKYKGGVDEKEAKEICTHDLKRIVKVLKMTIEVPLFQHEYDALVSLAFNCGGIEEFKKLSGNLNQGNYAGCCREFRDITNKGVRGLVTRRKAEMNMFTNAVYNSKH